MPVLLLTIVNERDFFRSTTKCAAGPYLRMFSLKSCVPTNVEAHGFSSCTTLPRSMSKYGVFFSFFFAGAV